MEENDELYIKVLAKSVKEELTMLEPLSHECCIYRAPERLRKLNPKAYTPELVSIGPLHHCKEELQPMEDHKKRYLLDFLEWSNASLEDFITCVKKSERRLRNCYAEPIEFKSEEFVKMVCLDAIFLITLLLKSCFSGLVSCRDRIFHKPRMILAIRYDIMLLENQVPFFILEDLFKLSNIPERVGGLTGLSMILLTYTFFVGRWGSWVTPDILEQQDFSQVEHFLDFLRICQRPQKKKPIMELKRVTSPTVTELYHAGVKFELHSSGNKFDIEFDRGILKIPHFKIDSSVEILLRNLQTFEECHIDSNNKYLNGYITMITMLVKDGKDVEILDQNGIVENWLQKKEDVAALFGNIECTINRHSFYFSAILEDLNAYCKNPWNKWIANLRQNYFNTPWAGISVAAAVILLLLTIMQTVCSILQLA